MTDSRQVLVSEQSLTDELKSVVTEACTDAQAEAEFRQIGGSESETESGTPSLLISVLPNGQRNVPDEVAAFVNRRYPSLPVMLLCQEPIVGGSVTLKNGRLTLVGAPLDRANIGSRLRTALSPVPHAANPVATIASPSVPADSPLVVREYRSPRWWASLIGPRAEPPTDPAEPTGVRLDSEIAGFSCFFSSSQNSNENSRRQNQAAWNELLKSASGAPELPSGPDVEITAVVQLDAEKLRWSLLCPFPVLSCWLISERRLPGLWNVSHSFQRGMARVHHMGAVSGDLLLLFTSVEDSTYPTSLQPNTAEFLAAARNGGPAVLDHVAETLLSTGSAMHALIAEVR